MTSDDSRQAPPHMPPPHHTAQAYYSKQTYKQEGQSRATARWPVLLSPTAGWRPVALFLAEQAAARAVNGTSPPSSFTTISSPGHAQYVSETPLVSGQAGPEGGRGGGMAPPCNLSYPLEEATSGGRARPRKRRRVRCCSLVAWNASLAALSACACVPPPIPPPSSFFVSLRPSLPAVLLSSNYDRPSFQLA